MPYARSGDIDIYYETFGSGHPLFFVHGGGGNLSTSSLSVAM